MCAGTLSTMCLCCKVAYGNQRKKQFGLTVVDSISYLIHYTVQFVSCADVKHNKQLISITRGGRDGALSTLPFLMF